MKKLLKRYNLNSDMEYFELIVGSFHNGQFSQAYEQFRAMPKVYRVSFLKSCTVGGWDSGLAEHKIKELFDLILA